MYSFESRVRYSETGSENTLSLNGIINYFQDCSTFHTESLGMGVKYLEGIHRAWLLSSWQIVVDRYPALGEKIVISTWPYSFKGVCGERNFTLSDENGTLLSWANSLWSFVDTETGRLARIPEEVKKPFVMSEKLDMDYASRKVPLPEGGSKLEPFAVRRHHLDSNLHVNNGQYIQMALEYIPADFHVRQMRAEYKKPAVRGDMITPVLCAEEGRFVVGLCDEEGSPYAVVEFS